MHSIITSWERLFEKYKIQKLDGIAIIGQNWSGKSTFCELLKAFVAENRS